MSKTAKQLKLAVAGFMQRDPAVFVRGTGEDAFDLLLNACNNARLFAERAVDFEHSKCEAYVDVGLTTGGQMSTAKLISDDSPVSIKKIITPFLTLSDGNTYPVDLWSRKKWDDRTKRRSEILVPLDTWRDAAYYQETPFCVIQDGGLLYIVPPDPSQFPSDPFPIKFHGVRWLPDYVTGEETDHLLDYAFDWLMYQSIFELNYFLKEDERVVLSDKLISRAWDALVKYNNDLVAANVDDVDLD